MPESSRRQFIKTGLCSAVAGATVVGGLSVLNIKEAKAAPVHPYGYPAKALDVEATRQLGYDGYKGIVLEDGITHKECSFATFNAIISQLATTVGYPYNTVPTPMMEWASGGVVGYATFCGALNGACAAIGLVCSKADATAFISDLLSWYAQTPLPTNLVNPTGQETPQSVAKGNLCHMSVTNWCLASGYASGSPERSERCARLAGDVAAMAVEMLNNGALGLAIPANNTTCRSCHYKGTDFAAGQFTRGKMDCGVCHVDLKQVHSAAHHKGK
jgi:hypothetical protein